MGPNADVETKADVAQMMWHPSFYKINIQAQKCIRTKPKINQVWKLDQVNPN